MNSRDVTLGDFVQQLLLRLRDNELLFKDERPWHELFYRLKKQATRRGKPAFLQDLFFDWNGEYPKSQALSEYLHALHWTGCMDAANPGYDKFRLNSGVRKFWRKRLDHDLSAFLNKAAEAAKKELVANAP